MNVTLLGTGAAEGCPGLFCRCETCHQSRIVGGKNIRSRTSSLIDGVLKIDFPPDTFHQVTAQNIDLCALKALLFTHIHDDHFCGSELQYLGPYFVTAPLPEPLPIYGPPEVIAWLDANLGSKNLPITLHTLTPWKTVCIARYHVTPLPAQHDHATTCFNYLIEDAKGATLLYASDTGWYEDPTWRYLESADVDGILVECQKGHEDGGYAGHLSIGDVLRMRDRLIASGAFTSNKPCAVTHLSHMSGLLHDEWEACLAPHNVQTGYDGMTFAVPPPTSGERQQRRLTRKRGQEEARQEEQDVSG